MQAGPGALNLCLVPSRLPLYLASLFISLVFLLVNLTCAVLVKTGSGERKAIVSVRVAINDTLFVLCAISLSICLYKISKMSLANIYLESKVRVPTRPSARHSTCSKNRQTPHTPFTADRLPMISHTEVAKTQKYVVH